MKQKPPRGGGGQEAAPPAKKARLAPIRRAERCGACGPCLNPRLKQACLTVRQKRLLALQAAGAGGAAGAGAVAGAAPSAVGAAGATAAGATAAPSCTYSDSETQSLGDGKTESLPVLRQGGDSPGGQTPFSKVRPAGPSGPGSPPLPAARALQMGAAAEAAPPSAAPKALLAQPAEKGPAPVWVPRAGVATVAVPSRAATNCPDEVDFPASSKFLNPKRGPPSRKPRLGRVRQKGSKRATLVELGYVRFEKGWHNQGYIFPDGYFARTNFRSSVLLGQVCVHECRVVGEGGRFWPAPTFQIIALDRPDEAFDGKSPTGCWNAVLRRINGEILRRIEDGENLARPPKTAIAGPEYFGFNNLDTIVAIEAQDPEHRCRAYWVGKEDREAYGDAVMEMVRSGLPPILPQEERPVAAPKPKKSVVKPKKKAAKPPPPLKPAKPFEAPLVAERPVGEFSSSDEEDDEKVYRGNAWNGVNRSARYAARCRERGEVLSPQSKKAALGDDDNPLPGMCDPITLEEVRNPAISPYGHVMGFATWQAVLKEQNNKCPFTKAPLNIERIKKLTKSNIELYRGKIVAL